MAEAGFEALQSSGFPREPGHSREEGCPALLVMEGGAKAWAVPLTQQAVAWEPLHLDPAGLACCVARGKTLLQAVRVPAAGEGGNEVAKAPKIPHQQITSLQLTKAAWK